MICIWQACRDMAKRMSTEPMFNIEERAPLMLGSVFIAVQAVSALGLAGFIRNLSVLIPLDTADIPLWRHIFSLFFSGFVHLTWSQIFVNTGMMVAFAVMTFRGLRAAQKDREKTGRLVRVSANVLFLIIFIGGVLSGGIFQWGWWAIMNVTGDYAVGAVPGIAALFATTGWAIGGRTQLFKFGAGWLLLNLIFIIAEPLIGPLPWPSYIGGYTAGALLAPYWVKPFSTGFSITR